MEASIDVHGCLWRLCGGIHGGPWSSVEVSMEVRGGSMDLHGGLYGAFTDLHGDLHGASRYLHEGFHGAPWSSPWSSVEVSMEFRGGLRGGSWSSITELHCGGLHGFPDNVGHLTLTITPILSDIPWKLSWRYMELHGGPWRVRGGPWRLHGDLHGVSMEALWRPPWMSIGSVDLHGGLHGASMDLHGDLHGASTNLRGDPHGASMDLHEGFHGASTDLHGGLHGAP